MSFSEGSTRTNYRKVEELRSSTDREQNLLAAQVSLRLDRNETAAKVIQQSSQGPEGEVKNSEEGSRSKPKQCVEDALSIIIDAHLS